jgi:ketosteroid isomerase-like protein
MIPGRVPRPSVIGLKVGAREYFEIEPQRTVAAGDCVVAEVRFVGRGVGSGVEVTIDAGHLVRFRGGLICEFSAYASWDEALAAADPCLASATP